MSFSRARLIMRVLEPWPPRGGFFMPLKTTCQARDSEALVVFRVEFLSNILQERRLIVGTF